MNPHDAGNAGAMSRRLINLAVNANSTMCDAAASLASAYTAAVVISTDEDSTYLQVAKASAAYRLLVTVNHIQKDHSGDLHEAVSLLDPADFASLPYPEREQRVEAAVALLEPFLAAVTGFQEELMRYLTIYGSAEKHLH